MQRLVAIAGGGAVVGVGAGLWTWWGGEDAERRRLAWLSRRLTAYAGYSVVVGAVEVSFTARDGLVLELAKLRILRTPDTIALLGTDANTQHLNLSVRKARLRLSALRWMEGKGLVHSAEVTGIRGALDRRHLAWATPPHRAVLPDVLAEYSVGPASGVPLLAHEYHQEFVKFEVHDCEVAVYQAGRVPLDLAVSSAVLQPYRYQWQHMDISRATWFRGSFDAMPDGSSAEFAIAPLATSRTRQVDIHMEITFPPPPERGESLHRRKFGYTAGNRSLAAQNKLPAPRRVAYKVHLVLRDVRTSTPHIDIWSPWSALYGQLARPIVAYLNVHPTRIDLDFGFVLDEASFDGSMGPWAAGVWDALSLGVYDSLVAKLPSSRPALFALMASSWAGWVGHAGP
ncbi:uncharacterized protein AMSG_10746 [Thecamonas trahens ATCC 50062]|uniref:Uncharacterized protein n=1 Tax=Thecamonas trahens ATCC 50062 TaxID=461836 RepID=A0A0L0DS94_THETB|nr:hypothetical protein AMSG_10746 [Thecamonas trahens ATCC 50062]KNC55140.1 hypothetical protein AMSG_10746 [Thecamonas trahens ATCC 50062]|eukprot:XP_013753198.1 hypothetical protein AMSG_10746 [Thecamonas trahens ATCC 50062]